jgi:hypothetical protein
VYEYLRLYYVSKKKEDASGAQNHFTSCRVLILTLNLNHVAQFTYDVEVFMCML